MRVHGLMVGPPEETAVGRKRAPAVWVALAALVLVALGAASFGQPPVARAPSVGAGWAEEIRAGYDQWLRHGTLRQLPIGLFDSGTGGMTVLEQILTLDAYHNGTTRPGSDGRPDFAGESFVFLADQANMPYGNYPAEGKTELLKRLILADARFLMTAGAHKAGRDGPARRKLPAKAVVIACNTATAYGKEAIAALIQRAGVDVQLTGVIDAGARDAVSLLAENGGGTVGVFATCGTVLSEAYPAAIRHWASTAGIGGRVAVVQQGALGLAGAIDGRGEYVDQCCKHLGIA